MSANLYDGHTESGLHLTMHPTIGLTDY